VQPYSRSRRHHVRYASCPPSVDVSIRAHRRPPGVLSTCAVGDSAVDDSSVSSSASRTRRCLYIPGPAWLTASEVAGVRSTDTAPFEATTKRNVKSFRQRTPTLGANGRSAERKTEASVRFALGHLFRATENSTHWRANSDRLTVITIAHVILARPPGEITRRAPVLYTSPRAGSNTHVRSCRASRQSPSNSTVKCAHLSRARLMQQKTA
jgi:hypothetical protein